MAIPIQLKEIWTFLESEVIWLHGRWTIYCQIYGTSPERINVINTAARTYFWVIQRVLMNDVQLTLMKLAVPATTAGKANLTLELLASKVEPQSEEVLAQSLHKCLIRYRTDCEKIKHRRNKDLAHFDLATQLADKTTVLPGPSREEIERALTSLRNFMNTIRIHFQESQMAYEKFSMQDDATKLLYVLKEGLRYEELHADGTVQQHDLVNSPYFSA